MLSSLSPEWLGTKRDYLWGISMCRGKESRKTPAVLINTTSVAFATKAHCSLCWCWLQQANGAAQSPCHSIPLEEGATTLSPYQGLNLVVALHHWQRLICCCAMPHELFLCSHVSKSISCDAPRETWNPVVWAISTCLWDTGITSLVSLSLPQDPSFMSLLHVCCGHCELLYSKT
jgi:hypothetical protein